MEGNSKWGWGGGVRLVVGQVFLYFWQGFNFTVSLCAKWPRLWPQLEHISRRSEGKHVSSVTQNRLATGAWLGWLCQSSGELTG